MMSVLEGLKGKETSVFLLFAIHEVARFNFMSVGGIPGVVIVRDVAHSPGCFY